MEPWRNSRSHEAWLPVPVSRAQKGPSSQEPLSLQLGSTVFSCSPSTRWSEQARLARHLGLAAVQELETCTWGNGLYYHCDDETKTSNGQPRDGRSPMSGSVPSAGSDGHGVASSAKNGIPSVPFKTLPLFVLAPLNPTTALQDSPLEVESIRGDERRSCRVCY